MRYAGDGGDGGPGVEAVVVGACGLVHEPPPEDDRVVGLEHHVDPGLVQHARAVHAAVVALHLRAFHSRMSPRVSPARAVCVACCVRCVSCVCALKPQWSAKVAAVMLCAASISGIFQASRA